MWCVLVFRPLAGNIRTGLVSYVPVEAGKEAYLLAYLPFSTFDGTPPPEEVWALLQPRAAQAGGAPVGSGVARAATVAPVSLRGRRSSRTATARCGSGQLRGSQRIAGELSSAGFQADRENRLGVSGGFSAQGRRVRQAASKVGPVSAADRLDRAALRMIQLPAGTYPVRLALSGGNPSFARKLPVGMDVCQLVVAEKPPRGTAAPEEGYRQVRYRPGALLGFTFLLTSLEPTQGGVAPAFGVAGKDGQDAVSVSFGETASPAGLDGVFDTCPLPVQSDHPAFVFEEDPAASAAVQEGVFCGQGQAWAESNWRVEDGENAYLLGAKGDAALPGSIPDRLASHATPATDQGQDDLLGRYTGRGLKIRLPGPVDIRPLPATEGGGDRWTSHTAVATMEEETIPATGVVEACRGIVRCTSAALAPHAAAVAEWLLGADWNELWQEFLGMYEGKDRLQLPTVDYAYQELSFYDPQTGEPNPDLVDGPANLSAVKLKLPAGHPVGKYADVGLKIVDVQLWAMVDVALLLYLDYRRNKVSYDLMGAGDAVRRALDNLWDRVQFFDPPDIYRRAFRQVRWYAERAIMTNTEYLLTREYAPWVSNDAVGLLGCPHEMTNWRWGTNNTYETTAPNASFTLYLRNYLDGYLEFSSRLTNASGVARLSLFVDGADRSDELVANQRSYLYLSAGQHTVRFVFAGEEGDRAEVAGFRLDNAAFVSAAVVEKQVAGTGRAALNMLLDMLVHYFDLHHRRKIKGSRLLWLDARKGRGHR